MNKNGLLEEPEFGNISKYLESGLRTAVTEEIKDITDDISEESDGKIVKNLMVKMYECCNFVRDSSNDKRKFKRSATEILQSKELTGCCDCSTLFTALARSKGIPSMQILTFKKEWGKRIIEHKSVDSVQGHFFTACFLRDVNGVGKWFYINTAEKAKYPEDVSLIPLNLNNRDLRTKRSEYYAFAFTRDYSDISIKGIKIDSINNMGMIQRGALYLSDILDWYSEYEEFRK